MCSNTINPSFWIDENVAIQQHHTMNIHSLIITPYKIALLSKQPRTGIHLKLEDSKHRMGYGEIAPLPKWSSETLQDCLAQLEHKQEAIKEINWSQDNWIEQLDGLQLFPAVAFGLESAILSMINPLGKCSLATSALFMGTLEEIFKQAEARAKEGYGSAKLKVSNLSFREAFEVIDKLKDKFRLRIDVNRAWKTEESLKFFSQFPVDAFDYVEEPFQNPLDLGMFAHPLAVDESFPGDLSLEQLSKLTQLKALIYKPTMQGGVANCDALKKWSQEHGVSLVLSSSFESDLGLAHVAGMAKRLDLVEPLGIGTYHYMQEHVFDHVLKFNGPIATIDFS